MTETVPCTFAFVVEIEALIKGLAYEERGNLIMQSPLFHFFSCVEWIVLVIGAFV